jgi:hypothetical protein
MSELVSELVSELMYELRVMYKNQPNNTKSGEFSFLKDSEPSPTLNAFYIIHFLRCP